jgi:hypothetical protein
VTTVFRMAKQVMVTTSNFLKMIHICHLMEPCDPVNYSTKNYLIRIHLNSIKINMLQYAYEEFENIKGDNQNTLIQWRTVNTMNKRKKQQKDNQRFTKHCTENWRSSNTNPTKNFRCTQALRKSRQFQLQ